MLLDPESVWPRAAGCAAFTLLDVRAPIEVQRSELPDAVALPILDDDERHQVGACYHERGHAAAVALALELVAPHRKARIQGWRTAAQAASRPVAFTCWRGGDRSRIATEWFGVPAVPRVRGGAKAARRFLLDAFEQRLPEQQLLVMAGLTGVGKTEALQALARQLPAERLHVLDLEAAAEHRGSAFGGLGRPQPSQATFENRVARSLQLAPAARTVLEDEARNVGRVLQPKSLWQALKRAPVVVLEADDDERVARIAREYVFEPTAALSVAAVRGRLEAAVQKLHKRLGGALARALLDAIVAADRADRWHEVAAHEAWIVPLLHRYYDRHYEQSLAGFGRRVACRGRLADIVRWFEQLDD